MSRDTTREYESPTLNDYGPVESMTLDNDKVGSDEDEFSDIAPLTGSIF